MFGFIQKTFIGLLTSLVNASSHTKCVSLSNQKRAIQHALISLHLNDYNPFEAKLYRCVGSCSTLNDLSNKVFVVNKAE